MSKKEILTTMTYMDIEGWELVKRNVKRDQGVISMNWEEFKGMAFQNCVFLSGHIERAFDFFIKEECAYEDALLAAFSKAVHEEFYSLAFYLAQLFLVFGHVKEIDQLRLGDFIEKQYYEVYFLEHGKRRAKRMSVSKKIYKEIKRLHPGKVDMFKQELMLGSY